MFCTVSVSIPQNLQDGCPLNRPMVRGHPFTGGCPVRIATTIFSWCLPNLSKSSALFLHSLPIKSLPCLQPGISFQVLKCWCSVQLIASLAKHLSRGHTIVTSRDLMWCYVCSWDVRGDLTLNYMAQIHTSVTLLRHRIPRGALVGSRASSPHTFLLLHTFREAWPMCRVFLSVFMTVFIVRRDAECS